MINTYRYRYFKSEEKEKEKTELPPATALINMGAFLQVSITHPRTVAEKLTRQGKDVKQVAVSALIDTGASSSIITPAVAETLQLVHTGYQKVSSVQDEQSQPVYYGFIIFPWGAGKEIPIIACPLKNVDCLIGRDILQHWHFSYNGPDGSIVICD